MSLIVSISGVRGTVGGRSSDGLTPISLVRFSVAYAFWLRGRCGKSRPRVVLGRDARVSGQMVSQLVASSLQGCGIDVADIGLATTPTVEIAVSELAAQGGVIVTASHNGWEWNALKLLNERGEFLSSADGQSISDMMNSEDYLFPPVAELGSYVQESGLLDRHIEKILALPYVDRKAVRDARFRVVYDAINSVGGIAVPALLKALGVRRVSGLNAEPTGHFAHNPEPLPQHLGDLAKAVVDKRADVGFAVDPDVDRLSIICEDGSFFGEEYTLVSVADFVLSQRVGNTVSNLSSTSALRDVTVLRGGAYYPSAVGEVNVVQKMREVRAVVGGEGNGGVILPDLHYGRDALVGIAIFLTQLARSGKTVSELRRQYPDYYLSKNRIELSPGVQPDTLLEQVKQLFSQERLNTEDGVRIDLRGGWVHLRKSNTEPIIRVYAEAGSQEQADELAKSMVERVRELF